MTAEIVDLYPSNSRDTAATLRKIADQIEAGEYGGIGCAALVLMGDTTEVFGMGENFDAADVALLLHAGFTRLSNAIEQRGKP